MISVDAARIFGRRMDNADLRPDFGLAIVFVGGGCGVFSKHALGACAGGPNLFAREIDRRVMQRPVVSRRQ